MRIVGVLLSVCCCLSAADGQWLEKTPQPVAASRPGFDPKDVVRQVGSARSGPSAVSREPSPLDGGEFLLDTSITYVGAPGGGDHPAVAFDGENFLVVWGGLGQYYRPDDIYGTRVTPGGTVLDPAGIKITTTTNYDRSPAVVFDGTDFLVVWKKVDTRGHQDIYGARVTPAGVVLDSAGIVIATNSGQPALAFDGGNCLVVWAATRSQSDPDTYGFDIYGARVTPAGVVLDPAGIAISTAADWQWQPSVAFDGENFLVAWARSCGWDSLHLMYLYDIYGARVTPAGIVLDTAGIAISPAASIWPSNPGIGYDGENFLVVWSDNLGGPLSLDIYGTRVTPAGVVLDTVGIAISTDTIYNENYPTLAFDGANSLVVWHDQRGTYGARVTPAGVVLDTTGAISAAVNCQLSPAVAFGDTNFLVVWEDYRSRYYDTLDLYGVRVTPTGVVLDSTGIAIATGLPPGNDRGLPAMSFDGENFLVVWGGSGIDDRIYGARVSQAGVVLDSAGITISLCRGSHPAVSFDGNNFLVVWEDYRYNQYSSDIFGARVTPAGVVLDPYPRIPIAVGSGNQGTPDVSFDGENYLVVLEDHDYHPYIDGVQVSPDGAVLGSIAIPGWGEEPAVSFDGTNFLVVWTDYRGGIGMDLYGARVSQAGVVLDSAGIAISSAPTVQESPAICFDGTNFLVAWADGPDTAYERDIYGARVTPAGVVFDQGPVAVQSGLQRYPALARGTGNQVLLVYQGWAGTVGGKTYNACRTWGKLDLNKLAGIAETMSAEVRTTNAATIVHGVLYLPGRPSSSPSTSYLLDVSGRKVLNLHPGANDVRALSPGVYFVREAQAQAQAQAVGKVVVTR